MVQEYIFLVLETTVSAEKERSIWKKIDKYSYLTKGIAVLEMFTTDSLEIWFLCPVFLQFSTGFTIDDYAKDGGPGAV